jgi:octaprenyl-diphosphate synthase
MTTPLDRLADTLAPDMDAVNALILAHLGSEVPLAQEIAQSLIEAGGKRIRPLLTLAGGAIASAPSEAAHQLAAAIEFIHSATLLHDDVVDESDLRRGQPSAYALHGNAAPVLVGDFLFARAFELMVRAGNIKALDLLARTAARIAEGEVLQLSVKGDLSAGADIYFKIIEAKTAVLFAAATEVGAILAGGRNADAARAYGLHLGMAFQIVDDVLDYAAQQPALGKTLGDDFKEGKITLPIWLALDSANEEERAFWRRTLADHDQRDGDLDRAMEILTAHDVFTRARIIAQDHAAKAREALETLPAHALTPVLTDLLDFVLERKF